MKAFLHVSFRLKSPRGDILPLVEGRFDKASDWIRYAPNCWLLYTSHSPQTWFARLMRIPGIKSHEFLICEVNLNNRGGYLDEAVWAWVDKYTGNRDAAASD